MADRISIEEVIRIYKVDYSFVDALVESELLHPQTEKSIRYIVHDELSDFERFINWHYDLEVNLQGIEIIHEMLKKVQVLQTENHHLSQRLQLFSDQWEEAEKLD